ncbi:MarR family winged helix-turn-helix transcriptional regulator [Sulfitobacter geojensis]|jgi:DNA-binding MarR family transcriptional regulator|uniref:MarR family transcriptional regulator n=1 Tax=Sulfitobacter geojensis TaxID=1342299 RepID=A0AAE3B7U5_9RHOB|nr:MarR family transcriptional regulator [Sulfitobacter geojensis]MBM1691341.1 MarR family transcriptional regulator [Sulfitobacter geojensis]MBM1695336.1 MarR family transcriptional regulator [Sulfitobacter geojensis]MBM1707436.1 MarR family transcriptional regulator [Sulfitobacter geojensis]MBM1711657.1 MarR family transcriptional regulator [Sulfitobacter geojensis]MBM1715632.1 MarR family transcriptional regulator [Sulfitobacter geojensis]
MNKPVKDQVNAQDLGEMGLGNFAPYLMNRIIGRYNAAISSEMAEQGLTTPQMRSLAVLSVIDGILIRELAVYAVVQQSTLSRALDTLDQNGLIRRETDQQDSRATRVFITKAGREVYDQLWPHMSAAYDAMFKGIDDAEKRAFVGTLQTMLRNIRKHDF